MSERVEHRGTVQSCYRDECWHATCTCNWVAWGHAHATREEAVTAYQEHVYAAMGREAAELLRFDHMESECPGQCPACAFLDRLSAALEVEPSECGRCWHPAHQGICGVEQRGFHAVENQGTIVTACKCAALEVEGA